MGVATSGARLDVGVRDLKNNLSHYLKLVEKGDEVVVTDRGRPVARLVSIGAEGDRLRSLIASGAVRPPTSGARRLPERRIKAAGEVSELVDEQRR